ncbi:hypothetical protein [Loigolactobacillus bifermentans]|uniref:Uncharacterized protein n=1 Tax=Loigolactobacillus bifermentans DSM 20003 TaxID=1423726 RepID=A0A0R1GMW0_9LACO|nr:hypothetical protein [Loigolactobacillus bifermentans]KRK35405.1 hypothetical protein FC07_GL000132 [Loigolactobacillus bifermentans DSM 20003]QGG60393.1 hypothetical protein LB003_07935 [Loigolactobacillus bifermentans]
MQVNYEQSSTQIIKKLRQPYLWPNLVIFLALTLIVGLLSLFIADLLPHTLAFSIRIMAVAVVDFLLLALTFVQYMQYLSYLKEHPKRVRMINYIHNLAQQGLPEKPLKQLIKLVAITEDLRKPQWEPLQTVLRRADNDPEQREILLENLEQSEKKLNEFWERRRFVSPVTFKEFLQQLQVNHHELVPAKREFRLEHSALPTRRHPR